MDRSELRRRLMNGEIVPLTADVWRPLEKTFREVDRHGTGVTGDIVVFEDGGGYVLMERPWDGMRILRRIAERDDVFLFVAKRREQYAKMFAGKGEEIDFLAPL